MREVVRTNLITLPEGKIVDRSPATRNTKNSTGKWEPTGQESHNQTPAQGHTSPWELVQWEEPGSDRGSGKSC